MKEQRRKNGKNIADDIKYVTKHIVHGVEGVKAKAVHCVVHSPTQEVDWKKQEFKTNGIKGFLKAFLPPNISMDKDQRSQQTVVLTATMISHYYPFIVDQWGECPGVLLASYEPETMKSSLSQVALKNFSTPSNFIELGEFSISSDVKYGAHGALRSTNKNLSTITFFLNIKET